MSDTESPIFEHAYYQAAISVIRQAIERVQAGRKPRHVLLVGPPGVGKTTVLDHIQKIFPPVRNAEGSTVPAAVAAMPPSASIKGFFEEISAALGDPYPTKGTETQMKFKVHHQLKHAGTQIVMVDESQHLLDAPNKKQHYHIGNWIKLVGDQSPLLFTFSGLPRTVRAIRTNEQLADRFLAPIMLPRLDWRFEQTRTQFLSLLTSFSKHFDEPMLCDESVAFRLYCATGGILRRLETLLWEANDLARRSRRRLASPSVLGRAYSAVLFEGSPVVPRPFDKRLKVEPTDDVLARIAQSMKLSDDPYDSVDLEPPRPEEVGLLPWTKQADG